MKTAAVIGAGFGGLALAIRLQSAGVRTTLVEARDTAGGIAHGWRQDGFTFDAALATIAAPETLAELWRLSGRDLAEDVTLLPVQPFRRLLWPDGTALEVSADEGQLMRQVAELSPTDVAGVRRFLDHAGEMAALDREALGSPFLDLSAMGKVAPRLIRAQAWRSLHGLAAHCVRHPHLREALSSPALAIGGNPLTASALHAAAWERERRGGVWFPRGGVAALAAAMVAQFERLGGEIRFGDPVTAIEMLGDHATGIACASGWRDHFDAVASNADAMRTYRDLLARSRRGERAARALERKRLSPSAFAVHFGIRGSFPGIPHQTILFGPRYEGLFADIFDHGVLPRDFIVQLHHPSVTDPSLAPEGCSTFSALVAVPHLGKLPVDWEQVGPIYAQRILDTVDARLIHGLADRLVTRLDVTPADLVRDLGTDRGAGWSLQPTLAQSGAMRVHHRDKRIDNLYFAGAATHPGAGVPGVLASAKITATLMLDDLRRS